MRSRCTWLRRWVSILILYRILRYINNTSVSADVDHVNCFDVLNLHQLYIIIASSNDSQFD